MSKNLIMIPEIPISNNVKISRVGKYLVVRNKQGFKPELKVPLKKVTTKIYELDNSTQVIEERWYLVKGWEPYEKMSKEKS